MNIWNQALITKAGLDLQAKMLTGNYLQITRVVAGAGRVAIEELTDQLAVTDPVMNLSMNQVRALGDGEVLLPVFLLNDQVESAFNIEQIGVYAIDPDLGEILFFITQADEQSGGEHIPANSEMPAFSVEWFFKFSYGQADGVTVTIDPAGLVTRSEGELLYAPNIENNGGVIVGTYPNLSIAPGSITGDMISPETSFTNVTAGKVEHKLTFVINGVETTFDGSKSETVTITPESMGVASTEHTHGMADVDGLQTALNNKAAKTHTHAIDDVTDLQSKLDSKSDDGHTHRVRATNVAVATSAWIASTAHEDYPYQATVNVAGATASTVPEVYFGFADAVSGNFAPFAQSVAGGVIIYAKEVPETVITIPTIILWE